MAEVPYPASHPKLSLSASGTTASFRLKPYSVSCCIGISVDCFLEDLIHGDAAVGILATKVDTETTLHELLVHIWVINGKAWYCGIVVWPEASIIHLAIIKRSTLGSWRILKEDGAAVLRLLLYEASQALYQPCQGKTSINMSMGCHSRWREYTLGTKSAGERKMQQPRALWIRTATPRRGKGYALECFFQMTNRLSVVGKFGDRKRVRDKTYVQRMEKLVPSVVVTIIFSAKCRENISKTKHPRKHVHAVHKDGHDDRKYVLTINDTSDIKAIMACMQIEYLKSSGSKWIQELVRT